jgi:membrane protein required for colicin V production
MIAAMLLPQDVPPAPPQSDVLQQLQALGWVDHTAIAVLAVFFVIGLFKGLIWQVSRIAILIAAYVVAGRFGGDVAAMLAGPGTAPVTVDAPGPGADAAAAPSETTLYLAYVLLFLAVLIVLSLLAMLLQKLAAKAGLGFFDRLGGGVLGVATGACVVLFGLFVVHMFFRESQLAVAAESSHSLRLSKRAIDWLGDTVPDELREVFALSPLDEPGSAPGDRAFDPLPGVPNPPEPPPTRR